MSAGFIIPDVLTTVDKGRHKRNITEIAVSCVDKTRIPYYYIFLRKKNINHCIISCCKRLLIGICALAILSTLSTPSYMPFSDCHVSVGATQTAASHAGHTKSRQIPLSPTVSNI